MPVRIESYKFMNMSAPSIYPLGDSAMTLDLGNCIEEDLNTRVLAIYDWLGDHPLEGVIDRVVAYSSVSVFYDPTRIVDRSAVSGWLMEAWQRPGPALIPMTVPVFEPPAAKFRFPSVMKGSTHPTSKRLPGRKEYPPGK